MAVYKKGDYYNPPSDYYDPRDGNWKTFTYIDHDKKTPTTKSGRETKEVLAEKKRKVDEINSSLKQFKENRIKEILSLAPLPLIHDDDSILNKVLLSEIIIRDSESVSWNEKLIRDTCELNEDFLNLIYFRITSLHKINNKED